MKKIFVEFLMLIPAEDREITLTVPGEMTADEVADVLMPLLKTAIVSDVSKKEVEQ